jgi:hypothetical protein
MNNKLIAALLLTLASSSAGYSQTLIAGWDFADHTDEGATYIGGNYVQSDSANYTDTTPNGSGAAARGTIYWNGSFGSDSFNGDYVEEAIALPGTEVVNNTINTTRRNTVSDILFGINFSPIGAPGQLGLGFNPDLGLGRDTIVFGLDTTGYNGISLSFAKATSNSGSATLQWFYKLGAAGSVVNTNLSTVFNSGTYSTETLDFSGITGMNNSSELFLVGVFTADTLGGAAAVFDNVQVLGATAVPEPSSFAALAGLVGLGFAAMRRRRA